MNPYRNHLDQTLPEASPNLCKHLWRHVAQSGLPLTQDDTVLLGRIVSEYFERTEEGKATALRFLKASVRPASPTAAYYDGHRHHGGRRLDNKDIYEFRGWIYQKKHAVPYEAVEVERNGNLEACDATGILGPKDYCIKTVKTYGPGGKEQLTSLSNYARAYHEQLDIRETATLDRCRQCPVAGCDYHPNRDAKSGKVLKLLPTRAAAGG